MILEKIEVIKKEATAIENILEVYENVWSVVVKGWKES